MKVRHLDSQDMSDLLEVCQKLGLYPTQEDDVTELLVGLLFLVVNKLEEQEQQP